MNRGAASLPTCLTPFDDSDWLAPVTSEVMVDSVAPSDAEALLRLAERKLEHDKTAARFPEPDYLDRLRLFTRAGYLNAARLCACSFSGDWGGYKRIRRCGLSNLCPYCSSVRHEKTLLANVAAYHHSGETAFVTLAYHGNSSAGHAPEADTITALWKTSTDALRLAITQGHCTGALISRELAVVSLVPLRVMSHIHAIVVSPHLNLDKLEHTLLTTITEVDDASSIFTAVNVTAKVHVGPHRDEGDLYRSLRYSMKTFGCAPRANKPSLPDLYRSARDQHEPSSVNDSVHELVHLFHQVTAGKHRTSSLGVLSHAAKESIRVPKAKQHRQKNQKVVAVAKAKARKSAFWDDIARLDEDL